MVKTWETKTPGQVYADMQVRIHSEKTGPVVLLIGPDDARVLVDRWRNENRAIVQAWQVSVTREELRRFRLVELPPVLTAAERDASPVALHAPKRGRWGR